MKFSIAAVPNDETIEKNTCDLVILWFIFLQVSLVTECQSIALENCTERKKSSMPNSHCKASGRKSGKTSPVHDLKIRLASVGLHKIVSM